MKLLLVFFTLVSCSSPKLSFQTPKEIDEIDKNLRHSSLILSAPEFKQLTPKKLKTYFDFYLEISKKRIKFIKEQTPSFKNTIIGLEDADKEISQALSVLSHHKTAINTPEVDTIFNDIIQRYQKLYNQITFDKDLFQLIQIIFDKKDKLKLNNEELKLLTQTHRQFLRNGVNLSNEKKKRLTEISAKLTDLSSKFSKNLLDQKKSLIIKFTKYQLKGVPKNILGSLKKGSHYILSAIGYAYVDVLKNAKFESTRKKVYMMMSKLGRTAPYNNENIIREMAALRFEKANLLSHPDFASYALEERMAKKPENVTNLLNNLRERTRELKKKSRKELLSFINSSQNKNLKKLMPWNMAYYKRLFKEAKYKFNQEEIKPYFELNNTLKGTFALAKDLFGLTFTEYNLPLYDETMKSYLVTNQSGEKMGLFYFDFYSRSNKKGGAWMKSFKQQYKKRRKRIAPHVINVLNITAPQKGEPTLLKLSEVETLMHEFGHALHSLLSDVKFKSFAGTSVARDFVEVPSMLFEKFLYTKEFLEKTAIHYKTQEKLPQKLIDKAIKSKSFGQAFAIFTQSTYALIDMLWHKGDPSKIGKILETEDKLFEREPWERKLPRRIMSSRFSHIFSGGYSAGYYTYMWSESFAADGFEYFNKDPKKLLQVANEYAKNILSKGGSIEALEAYESFKGSKMDPEAIFRVNGIK